MHRFTVIAAPILLLAAAGCGAFSPFGPASQNVVPPPTTAIVPPPGSIPLATTGPLSLSGPPGPVSAVPPGAIVSPLTVTPQSSVIVPAINRDVMWDQLVDIVDDYFEIDQEVRVKLVGNELTPGRIDTFPVTGATLLEPWRKDSVNFHERLESTLQSIRRRAYVGVTPVEQGFQVDITVTKELEDVPRPIKASAGAATFRFDSSLDRDTEFDADPYRMPGDPARPIGPRAVTAGWIPLGRDIALEQEMVSRIAGRLGGYPMTSSAVAVGPTVIAPSPGPAYYAPAEGLPGSSAIRELPPP
jgi:hypothetical protein